VRGAVVARLQVEVRVQLLVQLTEAQRQCKSELLREARKLRKAGRFTRADYDRLMARGRRWELPDGQLNCIRTVAAATGVLPPPELVTLRGTDVYDPVTKQITRGYGAGVRNRWTE
jgi:hypothetical protein